MIRPSVLAFGFLCIRTYSLLGLVIVSNPIRSAHCAAAEYSCLATMRLLLRPRLRYRALTDQSARVWPACGYMTCGGHDANVKLKVCGHCRRSLRIHRLST